MAHDEERYFNFADTVTFEYAYLFPTTVRSHRVGTHVSRIFYLAKHVIDQKGESVSQQKYINGRRASAMLNPIRDIIEGTSWGENGTTPVATTCAEVGK